MTFVTRVPGARAHSLHITHLNADIADQAEKADMKFYFLSVFIRAIRRIRVKNEFVTRVQGARLSDAVVVDPMVALIAESENAPTRPERAVPYHALQDAAVCRLRRCVPVRDKFNSVG